MAETYQGLGDKTRLRILNLLLLGPLCVCHLQEVMGYSQVKISKHLKYLREHGLITRRRYQNWSIYRLEPNAFLDLEKLRSVLAMDPSCLQDIKRLKTLSIDCRLECAMRDAKGTKASVPSQP